MNNDASRWLVGWREMRLHAEQNAKPEAATDPQGRLDAIVSAAGGVEELIGLLDDYRKIVGALAMAQDARSVLPDVRCWYSKKQLYRLALDLPEEKGRALLGC